MLRVKDPKASVKFYETLGMKMIRKIEQPEAKFDLYFMGFDSAKAVSGGKDFSDREGLIEVYSSTSEHQGHRAKFVTS